MLWFLTVVINLGYSKMARKKKGDWKSEPKSDTGTKREAEKQEFDSDVFPVIGIGASAWGLESLSELFKKMPGGVYGELGSERILLAIEDVTGQPRAESCSRIKKYDE
jgi:hypothetical protein